MKKELEKITDKDIYVIGDGHDLEHYKNRIKNEHTRRAEEVVWFGYAQNSHCLAPLIPFIKSKGLKLKAIAQCQIPPLYQADKFIKWNVGTYIQEISQADFAVLPQNGKLKSNNKEITAILSGIPVAKNKKNIIRLINPLARQKEMAKREEIAKQYDVKNIANKYIKLVDKLIVKNTISVYTAICGGYEKIRNDIKVFTDNASDKFKDPVMNAKVYKILSHKFFKTKYSVWLDGNISLKVNPEKLIELLGDNDIALFKHPYRNCIYQEHPHAKNRLAPQYQCLIDQQVEDYRKEGFPPEFGLAECGMIIRKNNGMVEEFNERWWAEVTKYSSRDQMSFPYVWWKMKDVIKIGFIEGNVRSHKYFKYVNHNN